MKAITVALIAFFFLRLLMGDVPLFDGWLWLDVAAAVGLVSILAIHATAVTGVIRRRNEERAATPRLREEPGIHLVSDDVVDLLRHFLRDAEWVDWISRQSKVVLLRCIPRLLLAYLFFLGSLYLFIAHPKTLITTPHIELNQFGLDVPSKEIWISLWWVPMALSLRLLYKAASEQQRWMWHPIYIVDDIHFIAKHQESALFPEEGREDIPIPLDQIVEVTAKVGYWGGMLGGFGDLHLKRRIARERDEYEDVVISNLPRVEQLAKIIRDHPRCPAGRSEEHEPDEASRIP
jgi:hypothetical protein